MNEVEDSRVWWNEEGGSSTVHKVISVTRLHPFASNNAEPASFREREGPEASS